MSKVCDGEIKFEDMVFSIESEEVKAKLKLVAAVAFPGLSVDIHYDRHGNAGEYWFSVKLSSGISRSFYPVRMAGGIKGSGIGLLLTEVYP